MEQFFIRILEMSFSAGWLIVVVIAVRKLLSKISPRWLICILWAMVAFRLISPIAIESRFSLMPNLSVENRTGKEMRNDQAVTEENAYENMNGAGEKQAEADADNAPVSFFGEETVAEEVPAGETKTAGKASFAAKLAGGIREVTQGLRGMIFIPGLTADSRILVVACRIWLVGMGLMLAYSLYCYLHLKRQIEMAIPLDGLTNICDGIESPFVLGIMRPRVYLPSSLERRDLEYVMAHECTHLNRGDHWWKSIGYVLLMVYWFHPLVWAAYLLLCKDIELACDESVISRMNRRKKKEYAGALLAASVHKRLVIACPVAFGEVGVKDRIYSVMSYRKPSVLSLIGGGFICMMMCLCFLTNPKTAHAGSGEEWYSEAVSGGADLRIGASSDSGSEAVLDMDKILNGEPIPDEIWAELRTQKEEEEKQRRMIEGGCIQSSVYRLPIPEKYRNRLNYRIDTDGGISVFWTMEDGFYFDDGWMFSIVPYAREIVDAYWEMTPEDVIFGEVTETEKGTVVNAFYSVYDYLDQFADEEFVEAVEYFASEEYKDQIQVIGEIAWNDTWDRILEEIRRVPGGYYE